MTAVFQSGYKDKLSRMGAKVGLRETWISVASNELPASHSILLKPQVVKWHRFWKLVSKRGGGQQTPSWEESSSEEEVTGIFSF